MGESNFEEMLEVFNYFQDMFEPHVKVNTVIATTQFEGYFVEIKKGIKKETINFYIDKDLILDTTNSKWPDILKGFENKKITFKEWKNGINK